jgi:hypothetical protein
MTSELLTVMLVGPLSELVFVNRFTVPAGLRCSTVNRTTGAHACRSATTSIPSKTKTLVLIGLLQRALLKISKIFTRRENSLSNHSFRREITCDALRVGVTEITYLRDPRNDSSICPRQNQGDAIRGCHFRLPSIIGGPTVQPACPWLRDAAGRGALSENADSARPPMRPGFFVFVQFG